MNHSRGLSVDQRLELLLARRYPGAQMDALGGGFFSNIGKVVKKVAPIALGAAAMYFGGPVAGKLLGKVGGTIAGKVGGKVAGKVGGKVVGKVAGKVGRKVVGGVLKKAAKGAGKVAITVAQAAAAGAISAGAIPLQPGALRSNEELLSTAVQIARSELMNEGINMRSPDAQDIVRQAVEEAGQVPPAAGFDFQKALPWMAGGGLLLVALTMGSRSPR